PLSYRTHVRCAEHGRAGKRNVTRKSEALKEYCDKHYNHLLPILAKKMHQKKVQQEKLKAVKARLNFEEVSQHSESGTPSRRRDLRKRLESRRICSVSGSPEPRFKVESRDVKGAPKIMRISGFIHGTTNPELIKRLHDKIPKSVDEMMRITTSFLRGEVAAGNQERKKSLPPWKQQESEHKQNFKK
ncbi:hypothetical protein Tco_1468888, partial [Tanacetum coccineum]